MLGRKGGHDGLVKGSSWADWAKGKSPGQACRRLPPSREVERVGDGQKGFLFLCFLERLARGHCRAGQALLLTPPHDPTTAHW